MQILPSIFFQLIFWSKTLFFINIVVVYFRNGKLYYIGRSISKDFQDNIEVHTIQYTVTNKAKLWHLHLGQRNK
jgi:hypothetical protein